MHRRVVLVAVGVALVVVLAGVAWYVWQSRQRTSYEQAVAWMPEATLRATYTDWQRVRALAEGESLDSASSSREVSGFLSRGYDLDLTGTSAVVGSTYAMNRRYGFSPIDAQWEMFGQSRRGAAVAMRFGDSVDLEGVERNLRRLGYTPPTGGAASGGVWSASTDLVATIDSTLTPVMENVVVLPQERVVLLSDSAAYASTSADVVTGSAEGLDAVAGTTELAAAADHPATAVLFARDFACEALGMAETDEEEQAVAQDLVESAGGVSPLAGLVVAMQPDRSLVVAMHFESSEQASDDLGPRVELASGEAPGQGGTFAERFRVAKATADDNEIVMDLEPAARDLPVLSDLTQGPLLFASC